MELELKLASVAKENQFIIEQRDSLKEEVVTLKEENSQVSTRVDSLLSVTQKERVQSTVDKLDLNKYIEQIASLKKNEQKLMLRLKQ